MEHSIGPLEDLMVGYRRFGCGFFRTQDWVVDGIFCDSSSFSAERFYLEAFRLPRFVPTDHLYFNYGFRIGPTGWEWRRGEPLPAEALQAVRKELRSAAISAVGRFSSAGGVADLRAAIAAGVAAYRAGAVTR